MSLASDHDPLWICNLGTVAYRDGVELQEALQARRQAEQVPDTLLLLEHPPVYTRGRRASDAELTLGEDFYRERGIEIVATDRGGRVTYHGPGQLVGYPIMRVVDVLSHLRTMEAAIIDALAQDGIAARSRCEEGPDWTGVWVQERKIASLGVHIAHGVSTHGFAINVVNDLTPFSWIVPCGLSGVSMTSVQSELGHAPAGGLPAFRERVAMSFCAAQARTGRHVTPAQLGLAPRAQAAGVQVTGAQASGAQMMDVQAGAPAAVAA
ncbi:MAG TPA: lipoyl(octanoyl) transferase LipB [Solirubrobacteraceae bacterium]|jgi:lipoyl(octanoyl) transferase